MESTPCELRLIIWHEIDSLGTPVKIPLSCVIVLSFFLFKLKNYGYLLGLAYLLYFFMPCLLFHVSLESQMYRVHLKVTPHTPCRATLLIIFLSSFTFYKYWRIHDLTFLDHEPKDYSFLFVPSTATASAWLEYSVFSRVMTSSVTPVFLTFDSVLDSYEEQEFWID